MSTNYPNGKGLVLELLILFSIYSLSAVGGHIIEDGQYSIIHSVQDMHHLSKRHSGIIFESFEDDFDSWEADADTPLAWFVTRTQEQSHHGVWSLNFTANGQFDDGTIWVVREISLPQGSWNIKLEFFFWSMGSDVNNWQVIACIGLTRPEIEEDFTCVGYAGIEGWSPYRYNKTLVIEEQSIGWIALGYNINWETWRTHYFDSITISGLPLRKLPISRVMP